MKLTKPIVGMDRSPSGNGYRFVASDGGIFTFGDAKFLGSMGGKPLPSPIVGMARTRQGDGYWLVGSERRHLQLRRRRLPGLHRRQEAGQPDRGDGELSRPLRPVGSLSPVAEVRAAGG